MIVENHNKYVRRVGHPEWVLTDDTCCLISHGSFFWAPDECKWCVPNDMYKIDPTLGREKACELWYSLRAGDIDLPLENDVEELIW